MNIPGYAAEAWVSGKTTQIPPPRRTDDRLSFLCRRRPKPLSTGLRV